ncbi:hypothetical protein M422DRAFT_239813 [Sphaerobolus stellatus SS14]|nr:hypothetical protein M422DRAFT_239813 [Sphaerobolus stellatus SS14]
MSVSSRDSEPHSGPADHQDSSSLTFKRQHRPPRNSSDGTRYIRCPHRNNERVNKFLHKYADDGVSDRKEISRLLAEEHGIHMSEATVARRRRTLGLAKRPGAPTNISDVKKRFYIWKHRDVGYRGLRRSRAIQKALKEDDDIHITEAYISQALKGVDEGKTGPHGEWRIEIYQPLPELDLYILIIRDAWTGAWVNFDVFCRDYKELSVAISYQYFTELWDYEVIPKQTTIQYANDELQEFEPTNILREYLSENISLDQDIDKISRVQPNYLIIKGVPQELSSWFDGAVRCWEERKDSYNDSDLRYRLLVRWLWGETVGVGLGIHLETDSFYAHFDEISLRGSDCLGETLEIGKYMEINRLRWALRRAIPQDESADRAEDVWYHLYPSKDCWETLNLSNLWEHFEEMLPLWKKQFTLNDTGERILTEKFVKLGDIPESPSPSSSIPPSEDPRPSSGSEGTETPYRYAPSTTPFLPQEPSIRGTYDFPVPIPQAGPSGSYQLPPFSSYPGGNPAHPNPHTQPVYFHQADGFNTFR